MEIAASVKEEFSPIFYTYATMRNLDKPTRIKEIARKDSMLLEVLPLDVTDDKSVADVIEMISNRHRRIDVLVNNAGYDMHGAVEDLSIDEIRTQFETNFFGVVRLMKTVLPMIRKQRSGIIVNVSSIGGRIGVPRLCRNHTFDRFSQSFLEGLNNRY